MEVFILDVSDSEIGSREVRLYRSVSQGTYDYVISIGGRTFYKIMKIKRKL